MLSLTRNTILYLKRQLFYDNEFPCLQVVSAECGDIIESEKMRGLVEGYIKVYKHRRTKHQMQLLSPH